MSKFFLLLILMLLRLSDLAAMSLVGGKSGLSLDILQRDPEISVKYQKGKYLLYDCVDEHWICTTKRAFNKCSESRKRSLRDRDEDLPCASIGKFSELKNCHDKQLLLTSRNFENRFCLHPDKKS